MKIRRIEMRRSIILPVSLAIVALLGGAAFGQDIEGTYDKRGKLTEINNLLSGDELESCSAESRRYAGTVTAVRFTEGRKIGDFTLRTARGAVKIHISPELYQRIEKAEATYLPTLVAKTRRVTVDTHQCGATRRALYIIAGIHTETLG
jgi:hypothetical protein